MLFARNEDPPLNERLIRLAFGDVDLVQQALHAARSGNRSNAADLQKIVDYILANRAPRQDSSAKKLMETAG